ncbi:uncharacterized protein LOC128558294 [Mercenaria mercenaria]|uniref:uncharacterized protein LOC128558294 n=1 Tax=Mercenaria mercenaria TaxID=6596 RepID=UPI00234F6A86|nr:uncharacterized protein LOC128558294 [Mercenaria mercenaria]
MFGSPSYPGTDLTVDSPLFGQGVAMETTTNAPQPQLEEEWVKQMKNDNGVVYQFRALCFGPTSAPMVFVKVTSVVVAHLRKHNIRLASYLDDWLAANKERKYLLEDRSSILSLLYQLGFIVNKTKSQLIPVQNLTYIGSRFDLHKGLLYPTEERLKNLKLAVLNMLQGQNSARHYLILLGMIASCLELVPNARLFMRPIQLHLLQNWSPSRMELSVKIPVTQKLTSHLNWWLSDHNMYMGRSLQKDQFPIILTTDASSKWGWGGHMNNLTCQGQWSNYQKLMHINCLEMMAVQFSLQHFLSHLKGCNVLIRSDNVAVCQYINHQGVTKSVQLCKLTMKLWTLALENKISLKAVHVMGKKNILADILSRQKIRETEWALNSTVV